MSTIRTSMAILLLCAATGCGGGSTPGNDAARTDRDTGTTNDTGPMVDVGVDAGCTSTMPRCDTCATAATNPYNACSHHVTNCIPFDNTRVPGWPDHIPSVGP